MWQRFTERARRVVYFGQETAKHLGYQKVDTEHLLLGLFLEDEDAKQAEAAAPGKVWPPAPKGWRGKDSMAVCVLREMGVDSGGLKLQTEQEVSRGNDTQSKDMELSAASLRVIDLTYKEAQRLENNYIGTEHLLLGLIREDTGRAGRILVAHDVSLEQARLTVARLQGGNADPTQTNRPWWARLINPK